MGLDKSRCGGCGKDNTALSTCSGCLSELYCSPQCQKSNWKIHKKICKSYKIQEIPGKGFGMVAIRDIKQGELIIHEDPVIVIRKNDRQRTGKELQTQFQSLDKTTQASIMSLHDDTPNGDSDNKLRRIFQNNGIDINGSQAAALYLIIPRINHSCAANVIWGFGKSNPTSKEVRTVRSVKKGEELLANYIDSWENSFLCHTERQDKLRKWKFECKCTVCDLPQEIIRKNNLIRQEIYQQHQLVPKHMAKWDVKSALKSAKQKLSLLLEIKDEVMSSLPASYLEVYEMAKIKELLTGEKEKELERLLTEAHKLSKFYGHSFLKSFENKVQDIDEEIQQIMRNNPQIIRL